MYPNSTKKGASVLAFPDVCKHMDYGKPTAIPYPTAGGTAAGTVQTTLPPSLVAAGIGVGPNAKVSGAAVAHSLRNRLNQLNTQLMSLTGSDPNRWHTLVDEYVLTTADLYKSLATSKAGVT